MDIKRKIRKTTSEFLQPPVLREKCILSSPHILFLQQKTNTGNEIVWRYFIFVQVIIFNKMLLKNTVVRCHILGFLVLLWRLRWGCAVCINQSIFLNGEEEWMWMKPRFNYGVLINCWIKAQSYQFNVDILATDIYPSLRTISLSILWIKYIVWKASF